MDDNLVRSSSVDDPSLLLGSQFCGMERVHVRCHWDSAGNAGGLQELMVDPPRPSWIAARQKLSDVFSRKLGEDVIPAPPLNVEAARLVETLYRIGDELEKQIGHLSAGGADRARAFATEVLVLAEEFAETIASQGAYSKANQILSRIQALVGEIGNTAVESSWRHPGDAVFDEYYERAPLVRARLQMGRTR